MKASLLNRRVHYWLSAAVAVPLGLVVVSGLLLQVKKQVPWVQPVEARGVGREPQVTFDAVLTACRAVPEAGVEGWADVSRVDVRPGRGLVKVQCQSGYEVQLDAGTGAVLGVAYRRSDVIESLHDGSAFGEPVKLGVFLPAGVALLVLWASGLYLFALPQLVRRRKGSAGKRSAPGGTEG